MQVQNVIKNSSNAGRITLLASSISIALLTGCTTGHVKPPLSTLSTTYAVENGESRYIYCSVGSSNTAFHTCPVTTPKTPSNKSVVPLTQNLPASHGLGTEGGLPKIAIESSDTDSDRDQHRPDVQVVSDVSAEAIVVVTPGLPNNLIPTPTTERAVIKVEAPDVDSTVASAVKQSSQNLPVVSVKDDQSVVEKLAVVDVPDPVTTPDNNSVKVNEAVVNKVSAVVSNNSAAITKKPVSVYFDFASYKISSRTLRDVVASLDLDSEKKISVTGYTDDIGPKNINDALALRRAISVMQMLIAMGIPDSQIEVSACAMCGLQSVEGVTARTRRMHRRVDIALVG